MESINAYDTTKNRAHEDDTKDKAQPIDLGQVVALRAHCEHLPGNHPRLPATCLLA